MWDTEQYFSPTVEVNEAQNSFRISLCSDIHNDVNDDIYGFFTNSKTE